MLPQTYHHPFENPFLEKFNIEIEPYLSDCNLSVYRLIRLIYMSRTDLHRKLYKAIGMSTTEYIRYIRIRKAAHLLLAHSDWSINQVASEVGFRNQGYFTKRFKEIYEACPMEFRERKEKLEHMS